jgi:hypothetical protein
MYNNVVTTRGTFLKMKETLRNTPEERRSHQHRGGSLKSQILSLLLKIRLFK